MLIITNRQFDPVTHNFSPTNSLNDYYHYCLYRGNKLYDIGRNSWLSELLEMKPTHLFIYIHGFNNQPEEDIIPQVRKMQSILDKFHSRSLVIPIIWPCDNDLGLVKDYWDDRKTARLSGLMLSDELMAMLDGIKANSQSELKISVIAHSMGNTVLLNCLHNLNKALSTSELPRLFENVFLMAPDIANDMLEDRKKGRSLMQSAKNVVCFYASDDYAMPASMIMNFDERFFTHRLGMYGPKTPVSGLEIIDCSGFNQQFDFPTGHTYFLDENSPVWERITRDLE